MKIIDIIADVIKSGGKVIYLAPSRELLKTLREGLINQLGAVFNIEIGTFDDLAEKIALPIIKDKIISEEKSYVLLKSIIEEKKEDIDLIKNIFSINSFVFELKEEITQFKRNMIYPEDLSNVMCKIDESLQNKLKGFQIVYDTYQKRLKELDLYDFDDIKKFACNCVKDTDFLNDIDTIILDGYTELFEDEKALLKSIREKYPHIRIIINIQFAGPFTESYLKNNGLYDYDGIEINTYSECNTPFKAIASGLFLLEKSQIDADVTIINAPCIEDEVRQVAVEIKEIYKKGFESSDVAIVVNNLSQYEDYIVDIFSKMKIKALISKYQSLSKMPVIKTIFTLLDLNADFFNEHNLLNLINLPYFDFPQKETAYRYIKKVVKAKDINDLSKQNDFFARLKLIKDLLYQKDEDLFSNYKNWLIKLIDNLSLKRKIITLYHSAKIPGSIMLRDIKALNGFLERLNILEDAFSIYKKPIKFDEFVDILKKDISTQQVLIKEGDNSNIRVLTPEMVCGGYYKYMFILGLNEGIFPSSKENYAIFTPSERERLYSCGLNIETVHTHLKKQKIDFINCISSCQERLFLSFRTSDQDGSYMIKSSFLQEIIDLVPNIKIRPFRFMRDRFIIDDVYCWQDVFYAFSKGLFDTEGIEFEDEDIKKGFAMIKNGIDVESERLRLGRESRYNGNIGNQAYIDDRIKKLSVSDLSTIKDCPFRFFLNRVLGVNTEDDKEDKYSALNLGSFYHEFLKMYFERYKEKGKLDETEFKTIIDSLFNKYQFTGIDILEVLQMEEIIDKMQRFIQADTEHIKDKGFMPKFLEEMVVLDSIFDDVKITCKIDRIDVSNDGKRFILYDYKTGTASYALSTIIKGENIQLIPYYYAAKNLLEKNNINAECVGLVFYSIKKTAKDLKKTLSGIISEGNKHILNKDKRTDTILNSNIDILAEFVRQVHLKKLIDEIREGNISFRDTCPVNNSFSYFSCDYKDICRFNPKIINQGGLNGGSNNVAKNNV